MKKFNKKNKIIFLLIIILLFFSYRFYIDNYTFEITNIAANIDNTASSKFDILNGKKIIHISDLHNQQYGEKNSNLISAIKDFSPDYILITGDMVNAESIDFDGFSSLIDGIKQYKCFYVVGNHELGLKNNLLIQIYDYLIDNGIYVLDNSKVEVDGINFYGLNYSAKYYKAKKYSVSKMNEDIR